LPLQTNLNIRRTFPKTILPEINRIVREHNSGNFTSEYEDLTDRKLFLLLMVKMQKILMTQFAANKLQMDTNY
jgi:hypothetical protein